VEGTFAWVGGPLGQILAGAGAAALLAAGYAVITGRAPRCGLPVLSLALLPVLYALIPLADAPGQGRYALFAVPMAALLVGIGLDRAAAFMQRQGWMRPWLVRTAGLALVCALGAAGLRDEPGQVLVAFPAPDVTMPADDSALRALLAAHDVKDAYAPYWIAYRVMFETGTQVTSSDYDRYPPIAAAVGASPDPAYLFITASRTLGSFQTWCREHHVGYREWQSRGFTVVQPATKVGPGALPH
jgi:hypothetical protein